MPSQLTLLILKSLSTYDLWNISQFKNTTLYHEDELKNTFWVKANDFKIEVGMKKSQVARFQ